jgi:hypothetical protein
LPKGVRRALALKLGKEGSMYIGIGALILIILLLIFVF